ncbi:CCN family member 5 [Lagenorhynchus albirostris]|uniref:CCN family member 5 n=1 Tax=Lagenorhynchus albirostris TaxID=27610 RepID=UPI0028EBFD0D|nr:CCN family member 5 [Lagenorhynchus albirostris]
MRGTPQTHLLAFSLLCLFSKVCAQLCPTPCTCPWPPPRCPQGVPLVLDGCNCCRVCARRLGEPCDHLHVCDPSQGLVCQLGAGPGGRGSVCLCKQCGLGVATRVSNQNRFCRLETQRRLCLLGPCPPTRGRSPRNSAF